MSKPITQHASVPGMFSLVLHSHLPWLNHHGRWPVGEEWLYQAWNESYIPMFELLEQFAAAGERNVLTLGITPILAAQLDDPYSLTAMHHWLGNFLLRSDEAARTPAKSSIQSGALRSYGNYSYQIAQRHLEIFESKWLQGAAPIVRRLKDSGVIELLSGPLTHPFQPLTAPALRTFALQEGLADAALRYGSAPQGIWAPECAYSPGLEKLYTQTGVGHFMVDGPALNGDTSVGRPIADSSVIAFGRDLQVSYQVWSPTSGYPGHESYRDFYTHDEETGLKPMRVSGKDIPSSDKLPYDPQRATAAVHYHVGEFINCVRERLLSEYERTGKPAHVIAAFDTELFGHWWHEGPQWLQELVPEMRRNGIQVGTLSQAIEEGYVGKPVQLGNVSWGTGKDFTVWNGPQVHDLVELGESVTRTALTTIAKRQAVNKSHDLVCNQIITEALLTLSSDWSFLVTKNTAAQYAKNRAFKHAHATREICHASEVGDEEKALALATAWARADNPFPHLDARKAPLYDA